MRKKVVASRSFTSWLILFLTTILVQPSIVYPEKPSRLLCFQKSCYRVEVAQTSEKRLKGLMGRERLEEDTGMLLIFDREGEYPIWMKNMKIPLDLVWIDDSLKVVSIQENVPPCTKEPCPVYRPHANARYVLEVQAGSTHKNKIAAGSPVNFENF